MNRRKPTWLRILALTMIAIYLGFAAIHPQRAKAITEEDKRAGQTNRAPDERTALIEAALFTRGEFFGAQAIVPFPTAEARSRLAEVQKKYSEDSTIYFKLAQLDEKLGQQQPAENELRRYV